MTTHILKGDLPDVAQVCTAQVTAYDVSTTYKLTINGRVISAIAAGSANLTATALADAWNASAIPEVAEITASATTDTVTFTGDTAGVPFAGAAYVGNSNGLTSSVSGGTGTIGAVTTTTAPTGKNWWVAANFDSGTLPGVGDTVYARNSSEPVKYGLDQSGAGTILQLNLDANMTGDVGLPRLNSDGDTTYAEYRLRYLTVRATTVNIGSGEGQGSRRILLDLGGIASTVNVFALSSSAENGLSALQLKGTSITTLNARASTADIAPVGGEVSTITTLNATGNAFVRCSSGVTLATVNVSQNADVITDSAITALTTRDNGRIRKGSGAVTTWNAYGQTNEVQGAGTIATLALGAGRILDASSLTSGVVITNASVGRGAVINDAAGKLTWTNPIQLSGCGLHEIQFITKQGATLLTA